MKVFQRCHTVDLASITFRTETFPLITYWAKKKEECKTNSEEKFCEGIKNA